MKQLLPLVILIILSLPMLSGCRDGQYNQAVFELDGQAAKAIYEKAIREFKDQSYETAVNTYIALYSLHPFSPYAASARFQIIRCYYKQNKMHEVMQATDKFLQLYPHHKDAEAALYLKSKAYLYSNFHSQLRKISKINKIQAWLKIDLSQRDVSALAQAAQHFEEFLQAFPDSIYQAKVKQNIKKIHHLLAGHEYHIARHYLKKQAYLAAFKRASEVITQYPKTDFVPLASALREKAGQKLGINGIAFDK